MSLPHKEWILEENSGNSMPLSLIFWAYLATPALALATLVRTILLIQEMTQHHLPLLMTPLIFVNGILSDVVTVVYLIPIAFCLAWISPFSRLNNKRWAQILVGTVVVLNTGFWVWGSICEWFFWREFSTRLNFIAVDYLIFAKEVVENLRQSFPMGWIGAFWAIMTGLVAFITLQSLMRKSRLPMQAPRFHGLFLLLPLALVWFAIDTSPLIRFGDSRDQELSRNGIYEFMAALSGRELDFRVLYPTIPDEEVKPIVKTEMAEPGYTLTKGPHDQWVKLPDVAGDGKRPNLILVTVESLGGRFIGSLGNKKKLTPYLDKLSTNSLFFRNLYATGTRTVRGLEALSLSLPPTPGISIVRRPRIKGLMTLGGLLDSRGYESKFIYGGHGLFDNMNNYFSKNHHHIVDRLHFGSGEVEFSNAWGVSDEDLLRKTLKEADLSYSQGKPFFSMVLTTSNHRPFTYPDGRIDIPSGTGRAGAVKYTDFAIGKFIEAAAGHAWFKNTIIAIVADHSADGRGVIDIPVETYHIPLWIYAPGRIQPKFVDTVSSQIDVIPTLLGLMGIHQPNMFMGKDILTMRPEEGRFFCGTYQKVGFYADGMFVTLGPKRTLETYRYDTKAKKTEEKVSAPEIEKRAIALYQYASDLYKEGHYLLKEVLPKTP